jgi:hypothetical protein
MNGDRLFLVQLYRWFPSVLKTITIAASSVGTGGGNRGSARPKTASKNWTMTLARKRAR